MTRIGIVVALPGELRSLTRCRVKVGQWKRLSSFLLVAVSGSGQPQAAAAAKRLVENGAQVLFSWGCAGALHGKLRAGSLVLPKEIVGANGLRDRADQGWYLRLYNLLSKKFDSVETGALVESPRLVDTTHAKMALAADYQAVAVDMESATVAAVARQHCLPFVAIRAVVDPLEISLPGAVSCSLDDSGRVRHWRLLRQLLLHPWEIGLLIRLGFQFHAAKKTLTRASTVLKQASCMSAAVDVRKKFHDP